MIGMGAETVVDYALLFKSEFGADAWVCGYADDMISYIPSKRVWTEGGYEGGGAMLYYGQPSPWTESVEDDIILSVNKRIKVLRATK